ncbi:MAG: hypothetical protein HC896_13745 [Bacteroidales bacterium]|nr:hypothetical protein [Bacteroidales bacterium]
MPGSTIGQTVTIPGDDLGLIIDRYWRQGLFSDVEVFIDSVVLNKAYLNIKLKERPRLNEFSVRGIRNGEKEDLEDKMSLKRGVQVTDNTINNVVK